MRTHWPRVALSLTLCAAGCTGWIADENNQPGAGRYPGNWAGNTPAPSVVGDESREYAQAGLFRLSQSQIVNSLEDLFGRPIGSADAFPSDPIATEGFLFSTVLARDVTTGIADVEEYASAFASATRQVFSDPTHRSQVVGCEPTSAGDTCVEDYLRRFSRQAWRRPVTDEELDRYIAVVSAGETADTVWTGLEFATAALLESPNFLYRTELGTEPVPASDLYRLSGHEVAARLSLLLLDRGPDDELARAADAGALDTAEGLAAQVERLLAGGNGESTAVRLFAELFQLPAVRILDRDPDTYGARYEPSLGPLMAKELELVVAEHARPTVDFLDILTTDTAYVNEALAGLYGMTGISGDDLRPVPFSGNEGRGGILSMAAFLNAAAQRTRQSITLRGKFVIEELLCSHIAPPPPDVETTSVEAIDGMTLREWSEMMQRDPVCGACHRQMDTIGFAFENYDGLGWFRTTETVTVGGVPTEKPVDSTTTAPLFEGEIAGARMLGEMLHNDPRVSRCVAEQVFGYANGTPVEPGQSGWVGDLDETFQASSRRFEALLRGALLADSFVFVARPAQEAP